MAASTSAPAFALAATTTEIREHFPALQRRLDGQPVAYFDGPGGTQVASGVVQAMTDYLIHHNANTHWAFPSSVETDAIIAAARAAMGDFLNASPDEIAFGNNMTSLTFHLARALGRGLGPGDEIVVTELDHHANVDPWRALIRDRGVTVKAVRMRPEDGQLDWADFERQVTTKTRILALGGASNAFGTINDLARGIGLAHSVGALAFVDAVHYAPHRLVDVRALDCDFLACSAYKFYGPHVGILYGKRDLLQGLDVPKLLPSPNNAPDRLETGTQNHEGIAGAAAAVDFLASIGRGGDRRGRLVAAFDALHERGVSLVARLWEGLGSIAGVTPFGPGPEADRTPTVSFSVRGRDPSDVCRALAGRGIFASHGDFYATTAVERMGHSADGLVRVGCACYTSDEEVDRLIRAVGMVAGS